jgi:membrane protein
VLILTHFRPDPPPWTLPLPKKTTAPSKGRGLKTSWRLAPWLTLGVMLAIWPRKKAGAMDAPGAQLEAGRGRHADSPTEIPAAGWKDVLWRTWSEFNDDQIINVAAGAAFFGVLALFPGMATFVSLYGMFADVHDAQKHLALLAGVLPADSLTFIGTEMIRIAANKSGSWNVAFAVSLLLSLWSANAGVKSLFAGLNIAYEQREKRGFFKLNLITLTFTTLLVAFLAVAMAAMVAAPIVMQHLYLDPKSRFIAMLRWPALLLVVMGGLSILYRFGPSREHARWRWVTLGGAVAAFGFLAVSLLFSWYVGAFAHYDVTYGSLGAIVGFMTWMWLNTVVILLGAELNAEMEHQTMEDSTTGAPLPMGARGARMADTLGKAAPGGHLAGVQRWFGRGQ